MAYVEPGTDFCLNCGETVVSGDWRRDCKLRCRLVGEIDGRLCFETTPEHLGDLTFPLSAVALANDMERSL